MPNNNYVDLPEGSAGSVNIGTIDSQTPSANGLVVSGSTLYAQSASATVPGMVNNLTQSFSGNKTFTGTIAAKTSAILNGSTSGAFTLSVPSTVTSYALTMPNAQGTASTVLMNDGAGAYSWQPTLTDITRYVEFIEDFLPSSAAGEMNWASPSSGTASGNGLATGVPIDANHPGVAGCFTGTTTTGRSAFSQGLQFLPGGGTIVVSAAIYIPTLSLVSDEYIYRWGMGDSPVSDWGAGVYFEYDRLGSGTTWQCKTAKGSTRTTTDSGVTVVAGAWIKFQITINAAATSVDYSINGVSVATITTNIPNNISNLIGPLMGINKSAGTTNTAVYCDYYYLRQTLTTQR